MGGVVRENPGLRRVEVADQGVGETGRETMAGPVMGGPPLTMPQGIPTVYGPVGYPAHLGNPGFWSNSPSRLDRSGFGAGSNDYSHAPTSCYGWKPFLEPRS